MVMTIKLLKLIIIRKFIQKIKAGSRARAAAATTQPFATKKNYSEVHP
jgi:hypothetical protein